MRRILTLLHRYAGLVLAGFLIACSLTGALVIWNDPLESAIRPDLFLAHPPATDAQPIDPIVLRDRVLERRPGFRIPYVPLHIEPGRTVSFFLIPTARPAPGAQAADNQVFADPYTGDIRGSRRWGDIGQGMKNLMPFVYRLHITLAMDTPGRYLLGGVALLWTMDCLVALCLTFPPPQRGRARIAPIAWLRRWQPAWRLRCNHGTYKKVFDLHRAGGLWIWAMLLILAWSSVALNLREVYDPVMRALFKYQLADDRIRPLAQPQPQPRIPWPQARDRGRHLMAGELRARGLEFRHESALFHDSGRGIYRYEVRTDRDIRDDVSMTAVYFDAQDGTFLGFWQPTGGAAGDTLRMWLTSLHRAAVWGWPFKVFMSAVAGWLVMLCATGTVIWWKKRKGRAAARSLR